MPSFNSVFALVSVDDGVMTSQSGEKKQTWTVSLISSDRQVGDAVQHMVNEVNSWLFLSSKKPVLEQVVVLVFALMADAGFVAVPGAADLTRIAQFSHSQVALPHVLAPTQRLLFSRPSPSAVSKESSSTSTIYAATDI
jgi:hypothetical protein